MSVTHEAYPSQTLARMRMTTWHHHTVQAPTLRLRRQICITLLGAEYHLQACQSFLTLVHTDPLIHCICLHCHTSVCTVVYIHLQADFALQASLDLLDQGLVSVRSSMQCNLRSQVAYQSLMNHTLL